MKHLRKRDVAAWVCPFGLGLHCIAEFYGTYSRYTDGEDAKRKG